MGIGKWSLEWDFKFPVCITDLKLFTSKALKDLLVLSAFTSFVFKELNSMFRKCSQKTHFLKVEASALEVKMNKHHALVWTIVFNEFQTGSET